MSLNYEMPFGEDAIDNDENNPLARALRRALIQGNPDQKLVLCLCREVAENSSSINQGMRWFGAFVLSKTGKVVFFPGTKNVVDRVLIKDLQSNNLSHNVIFDHITLDGDYNRWHITSINSQKHIPVTRTFKLGKERRLWFGISISNYNMLREVKRITHIQANVPESDYMRRVKSIEVLDNDIVHQILELHEDKSSGCMINHFSVIVLPKCAPDYKGRDLAIPTDPQFIDDLPKNKVMSLLSRHHRISVTEKLEFQIIALGIPGKLKVPILITGQANPYDLRIAWIKFQIIAKSKRLSKLIIAIVQKLISWFN